jgi:drug/metabolite transporter (DMT)-like permease
MCSGLKLSSSSISIFFEPMVTVLVARVVLGEVMTSTGIAGAAAIILGVWLVNRLLNGAAIN